MTDLRARILEQIDEVEIEAQCAADVAHSEWGSIYDLSADTAIVRYPLGDGRWGQIATWGSELATGPYSGGGRWLSVAEHIALWSPTAVLTLCAGARQLANVHTPVEDASAYPDHRLPEPDQRDCEGCGVYGGVPTNSIGTCPNLQALARMLGIDPDAT